MGLQRNEQSNMFSMYPMIAYFFMRCFPDPLSILEVFVAQDFKSLPTPVRPVGMICLSDSTYGELLGVRCGCLQHRGPPRGWFSHCSPSPSRQRLQLQLWPLPNFCRSSQTTRPLLAVWIRTSWSGVNRNTCYCNTNKIKVLVVDCTSRAWSLR